MHTPIQRRTVGAKATRLTMSSDGDLGSRRSDVLVYVPGEYVERHVSTANDRIVECLEIVFRAKRGHRPLALTVDLAVPDLVAARLPGPRAIAIDFARDFQRIRSVHVDEKLDALLARPLLGMNASVDHETARAERNRLQVSNPPDGVVLVGAELVGELLRVQAPTF